MNTTFILLMVLSCCAVVATFMTFSSAMYYRRYKDNGAYMLSMKKYIRATIILLIVTALMCTFTVLAATNCPECDAIAMHSYCEHCGAYVEQNPKECDNCGNTVRHEYCGFCGTPQGGSK